MRIEGVGFASGGSKKFFVNERNLSQRIHMYRGLRVEG